MPEYIKSTAKNLLQLGNQEILVILANQRGNRIFVYAENEVKIFSYNRGFNQIGTLQVDGYSIAKMYLHG